MSLIPKNISIDEIPNGIPCSKKTVIFCKNNSLPTLNVILEYYFKNRKSFWGLKNCTTTINNQLKHICKIYEESYRITLDYAEEDITIFELVNQNKISTRAASFCTVRNINTFNQIILYYLDNRSFQITRNVGMKTSQELLNLITYKVRYSEITTESKPAQLNTLNDYALRYKLSDKAYFYCTLTLKLKNIDDLLSYNNDKGTFLLNGVGGEVLNRELKHFCEKILNSDRSRFGKYLTNETIEIINNLSPIQKSILYKHIEYLISNLSVRSANCLTSISDNLSPKRILETVYKNGIDFTSIRNLGEKTHNELIDFKNQIIEFIATLKCTQGIELTKKYTELILKSAFKKLPENLDIKIETLFENHGKLKLFSLIDFLINESDIFNSVEKLLFPYLFSTETRSLHYKYNDIAKIVKLTSERVRQLKIKFEVDISNYFKFISNFLLDEISNYGIPNNNSHFIVDDILISKINLKENVNYNKLFYATILNLIQNSKYIVLSTKEKYSYSHIYKNAYLISKSLFNEFDFRALVDDVKNKINSRIDETYSFKFIGYLYNFKLVPEFSNLHLLSEICELLIFNECEIVIDREGYIVFERNIQIKPLEYCETILNKIGKPMTVDKITEEINKNWPESNITTNSTRTVLQRNKHLFIFFGRTSTYGLKIWEKTKPNIKGGTIRKIVEEFLNTKNTPIHISEITKHVVIYRPETNSKNIIQNLKLDSDKCFNFFPGEFVGLNSKSYKNTDINFKRINGFAFRNTVLEKYIGYTLDEIVEEFYSLHKYNKQQTKAILKSKIDNGILEYDKVLKSVS